VHFVHRRSPEPNALPLLLVHGWPGTFFEFSKVIEPLANPRAYGGNPKDAFDVVVASLPGYGFSQKPTSAGHGRIRTGHIFIELMKRLGYQRYGVQGGDIGRWIASTMALDDVEHVAGIHLNYCDGKPPNPADRNQGLTSEETRRIAIDKRGPDEIGYSQIQGSRPQTLGYALNDSPVGLAAWIVEKYRAWCDCHGDPESVFTKDELLTTVMIYWVTQTATSSARYYYEGYDIPEPPAVPLRARVTVPTACTVFPEEVLPFAPRSWAENLFNVQRFTFMPRGGHFAALEQPEMLVNDVRAFFAGLR
jgi:pimeloyl-ACP methyl ester carboxylesterase